MSACVNVPPSPSALPFSSSVPIAAAVVIV